MKPPLPLPLSLKGRGVGVRVIVMEENINYLPFKGETERGMGKKTSAGLHVTN
jgi:hypothetical protein